MNSINKTARVAGLLYLSLVPLVFFGFPYGPSSIVSESSLRFSIVVNLFGAVINVFVVLALYKLLKSVNKDIASLMVILLLLSVPIAMLNELNHVAATLLLNSSYLPSFTTNQLQALVLFFHDLHKYGLNIAGIFWGLWLFPMGYLVFKSGFLPRILGILLIIGCLGWLADSLVAFLLPSLGFRIGMLAGLGEVLFPLWLVVKGINLEKWKKRLD